MLEEMIEEHAYSYIKMTEMYKKTEDNKWRDYCSALSTELSKEIRTRCNELFEVDDNKLWKIIKDKDDAFFSDFYYKELAKKINQASLIKPKEKA